MPTKRDSADEERGVGDVLKDAIRHTIPGADAVMDAAERTKSQKRDRIEPAADSTPRTSKADKTVAKGQSRGVAKGDGTRAARRTKTQHGYTTDEQVGSESSQSKARAARMRVKEEQLAELEASLTQREAELTRREAELKRREQELAEREAAFAERVRTFEANARRTYTVQGGDSLSRIAQKVYGDASRWHEIFEANRGQIANPDLIHPGQVLTIP